MRDCMVLEKPHKFPKRAIPRLGEFESFIAFITVMRYTGFFTSCLLPLASCLLPLASCLLPIPFILY
ncbi:hypothetical protein [Moorena bouillonii]|uniref:hypothetical protein n=1 Tax=Moorena bouillonii TaxID=207920 RepID=UPI00117CC0F2|nr:hypothetical protein [Moorena bouillonii]